jgi:hypothetical protein
MSSPALRLLALRGLALLAGFLAAGLLLLVAELSVRAFVPEVDALSLWLPNEASRKEERDALLATHDERRQVHESDRHLFWKNRADVDVVWRGARVRTNSLGLRDDEVPPVKGDDEYRILVLGESTAFGDEIEKDESFPEVLEEDLDRRSPHCRISVINAAVTGYSLFQSYKYLELRGIALDPDLVLIYHGYNDFLPTTFAAERSGSPLAEAGMSDREMFDERSRFPNSLDLYLYYESAAYRWLRSTYSGKAEAALDYRRGTVRRVPKLERKQILEAMRSFLAERGVAFVILVPAYRSFGSHRAVLLDFAERTGTPAIDLLVSVPPRPRDRAPLFLEGGIHPIPALHARFAEEIGRRLLEEAPARGLAACLARDESAAGSEPPGVPSG